VGKKNTRAAALTTGTDIQPGRWEIRARSSCRLPASRFPRLLKAAPSLWIARKGKRKLWCHHTVLYRAALGRVTGRRVWDLP